VKQLAVATDAQGRQLSDDGYYYWDGANWQPVAADAMSSGDSSTSSQPLATDTDSQGRPLSGDGNYYWDGANWQLVAADAASSGDSSTSSQGAGNGDSSGGALDTSGLVSTLQAIASMDEEALARSSSSQLDEWIESLTQWHDYLSQQGQGIA
jgi:hypothetical protein